MTNEKNGREKLIDRMIRHHLQARGIASPAVLDVMRRTPREHFTTTHDVFDAYADCALPIDCGQTISQPYIVALMTEALELTGKERVLEVGTGSGYQTAILSQLASSVVTIERHRNLADRASRILTDLGCENVEFFVGDGSLGCPERAPFERIIVTAASDQLPPALFQQLTEGGIIVAPLGTTDDQSLWRIEKVHGEAKMSFMTGCRFVPLIQDDQ